MVLIVLVVVVVVVGQLLAGFDFPQGNNPYTPARDLRLAVGLARVVDVARGVPEHAAVDVRFLVQLKNVNAAVLASRGTVLALQFAAPTFRLGDALAGVFDDARAARDFLGREHAAAVDFGAFDHRPFAAGRLRAVLLQGFGRHKTFESSRDLLKLKEPTAIGWLATRAAVIWGRSLWKIFVLFFSSRP